MLTDVIDSVQQEFASTVHNYLEVALLDEVHLMWNQPFKISTAIYFPVRYFPVAKILFVILASILTPHQLFTSDTMCKNIEVFETECSPLDPNVFVGSANIPAILVSRFLLKLRYMSVHGTNATFSPEGISFSFVQRIQTTLTRHDFSNETTLYEVSDGSYPEQFEMEKRTLVNSNAQFVVE
ncbi:hypothetical protein Clacol_008822 [Clathrus columnatus]|uniref:Helicase ATP-binding domain-containing protein n=1 Tax=Clathrus columnatus TaxID=1419009 RepID=A0AAV5ALB3_9AGAM|nr:hypothetical protein Clacol_008822 [Clathrus columnatus]